MSDKKLPEDPTRVIRASLLAVISQQRKRLGGLSLQELEELCGGSDLLTNLLFMEERLASDEEVKLEIGGPTTRPIQLHPLLPLQPEVQPDE